MSEPCQELHNEHSITLHKLIYNLRHFTRKASHLSACISKAQTLHNNEVLIAFTREGQTSVLSNYFLTFLGYKTPTVR
jgi:hypothetical protein